MPAGYDADHHRVELGKGAAVFEAACDGLRRWSMFPASWTQICPPAAPIPVGTAVAVLARVGVLWCVNPARVVYVINEHGPRRRFGFAYGTLPGHAESGEERFSVEWGPDDVVWYDLRAFSRPGYRLARLAYPLARTLQRRFVVGSQAAIRGLVTAAVAPGAPEKRS
jgi:uncharacterized protein (UPF0548 family)